MVLFRAREDCKWATKSKVRSQIEEVKAKGLAELAMNERVLNFFNLTSDF
jgi:hypothetical protein